MEAQKIQDSITDAPIGALIGAISGYALARGLGYDKKISVVSFISVGIIIGTIIGKKYK